MTLVEAREINPPANQEPLHWRLLTSLEVGDAARRRARSCGYIACAGASRRCSCPEKRRDARLEETQMHEAQRAIQAGRGRPGDGRVDDAVWGRCAQRQSETGNRHDQLQPRSLRQEQVARRWRARPNTRKTPIRRILGLVGLDHCQTWWLELLLNRLAPRPCGPDGEQYVSLAA